jgi:BMFP domain-containing protein YqiC
VYQLLTDVTGVDGRPGDLLPPAAFAGADLDWLVRTGAVRPAAGLSAARPDDPPPAADLAELTARVAELEAGLEAERAAHAATRAAGDGGLSARVAELEAGLEAERAAHAATRAAGDGGLSARVAELEAGLAIARGSPPADGADDRTVTAPVPEQPAGVQAEERGRRRGR